MVVGVCRIVLALPYNNSLKGKRSVVRKITERARHRFNVAAAEVDELDVHRRAVLGFSAVSNDAQHLRSIMDKLAGFAASATEAQVVDTQVDVFQQDFGLGGPAFEDAGIPGGRTLAEAEQDAERPWSPAEWDDEED